MSQDLASAKFFLVVTVGRPGSGGRELRLKPRRLRSRWDSEEPDWSGLAKGISECVADCHVLVAGRMRRAEIDALTAMGRKAVLTDLVLVEDIISSLASKGLADHPERVLRPLRASSLSPNCRFA